MMNKFDFMGKDAVSKMEDLMNVSRLNELLHKKEEEEKKKNCILWVLAIFGAVAAVQPCVRCVPFLYTGLSGGL